MKLESVKKWINGKPLFLGTFSVIIAASAEQFNLFLKALKNDKFTSAITPDNKTEWIKLYKNHRHLQKSLKVNGSEFISQIVANNNTLNEILGTMGANVYEQKQVKSKYQKPLKQQDPQIQNDIQSLCLNLIENTLETLAHLSSKDNQEKLEEWKHIASNKEMAFLFSVWLPCWLNFGKSPTMILYKARHEDLISLEELLKIDKAAIYEPKIAEIWNQASKKPHSSQYEIIHKALAPDTKQSPGIRQTKYLLAGFISFMGEYFNFELKYSDIRDLFDAIAQDLNNQTCDTDLPESKDAFRKAVSRNKPFWKNTFYTFLQ